MKWTPKMIGLQGYGEDTVGLKDQNGKEIRIDRVKAMEMRTIADLINDIGNEDYIPINQVKPEVLDLVIQFVNGIELPKQMSDLQIFDLFGAADYLDFPRLISSLLPRVAKVFEHVWIFDILLLIFWKTDTYSKHMIRFKNYLNLIFFLLDRNAISNFIGIVRGGGLDASHFVEVYPQITNDENWALLWAVKYNRIDVVKHVLQYKKNTQEIEPMTLAAKLGNDEIVSVFLKEGFIPTDETISLTARNGHVKTVELLLDWGIPLSVLTEQSYYFFSFPWPKEIKDLIRKRKTRHMDSPIWVGNRVDDLHMKILEAKASKRIYLVDEDRFIFREQVQPEWEYYPEYRLAGTHLKQLVQMYEARLRPSKKSSGLPKPVTDADKAYSHRLVFKDDLTLSYCLNKWTPVKVVGSGAFGTVYQVCDDFTCNLAVKIAKNGSEKELELFKKASDAGLAPLFQDGFICKEDENLIIISEMYHGDLYQALKDATPFELEKILETIFTIMYRLLYELNIDHKDTKYCNFLYNSIDDIRIADFGKAVYQYENKTETFETLIDMFFLSIQRPSYGCDFNGYDYFELGTSDNDNVFVRAAYNVIRRHPEWKISKLRHVDLERGN